ncbi:MAG TPA: hypothetical protein P5555_05600 [Candidatus Paceibacterota bacterium]|nr:hypothetical protein [Verrucomicrobiota bacterium]HOX02750.1 hypothetical protein [Verrucomicrobiota bacterium]HRZ44645.1 hypothetical protein [Candidatus Paceibacterota bacterium]HRZ92178.1 hypothetical protein [Candidatus Paceibacterota bacterium]
MNPSELFDLWAPPSAVWSSWAKPVLFAETSAAPALDLDAEPLLRVDLRADQPMAVVLDLPSAEAVRAGLALVEQGFRPVPLFNGARGPQASSIGPVALVDNDPILAWLSAGARILARCNLADDAPPAFLLDSRRQPPAADASPGRFDNRWMVFPQDFPSANFLRTRGIARGLLIQSDAQCQPREDLAHVLLRWQEAELALFVASLETAATPQPLVVNRPRRFRSLWYRILAVMGLRRNSAGGFGSIVPMPSSAG